MKVTRTSIATGITRTIELPITQSMVDAHRGGMLVQDAFPHLTPDQREFYNSGITQDEWNEMFPPDVDYQLPPW